MSSGALLQIAPIAAPAQGRRDARPIGLVGDAWELSGVSLDPHRAAPRLRGRLDLREGLQAGRLAVCLEAASAGHESYGPLSVDVAFVAVDSSGGWTFSGTVTTAGVRAPATVTLGFDGIHRRGDRETASLSLSIEWPTRRHGRRTRVGRTAVTISLLANAHPVARLSAQGGDSTSRG